MTTFEIAKALAQARCYGLCEGCREFTPWRVLDPHHRMTRGSGGVHGVAADVSNDVRNLLMLCRVCHDRTLADAEACMAIGWVIERRAGVDPREVPAKIYTVNGYGWWYLTESGGYRWADDLNLQPSYTLSYQAVCPRCGCDHPGPDFDCPDSCTCHIKIENDQEETA